MYNYIYDIETGGLILNTSPVQFSKEPRPVYYKELDLLGFDKYFNYEKQDVLPYMWAEANKYYYFGRLVAQTKGGSLYAAPELEIKEKIEGSLKNVDIDKMLEKNSDFLHILEQETVKRVYDVWKRYKGKLDVFHVAFSGGKDSLVLLELVKRALPKDEFVVVFGDTQMEFSDTYDVVDKIEKQCKLDGVKFYRAKSHMNVHESWKQFAPPSRVLRWCCSVHKSVPQVIKLREVLEKDDYRGLAYVGVRGAESVRRSEYEFESNEIKQKGQRTANPILDWMSYEVWLYIYFRKLIVNETYKKGNTRAGCLLCPMSPGKADYLRYVNYKEDIDQYVSIIKSTSNRKNLSDVELMNSNSWIARKNGMGIETDIHYKEQLENGNLIIEVRDPKTDWKEWIKTLGDMQKLENTYFVDAVEGKLFFKVNELKNGYKVVLSTKYIKYSPTLGKYFRQVFRKSAYCMSCKTCEVNCKNKCISLDNGLEIKNCIKCRECHSIPMGCLACHSLKIPQGDGKMRSINTFGTHAPKTEWFVDYFDRKDDFLKENGLGSEQKSFFNRFLRDAGLIAEGRILPLTEKLASYGWDSEISLGIMLANISYNPQFKWYIRNIEIGRFYKRKDLENVMLSEDVTVRNAKAVLGDYKRIVNTPFGLTLNFGYVDSEDNYTRNKCHIGSPIIVLYSLYKFAEACGDYHEFTISRLFNYVIDSDGISPTQIYGIEEEEIKSILLGLSVSNSDFVITKFTHDLDTISLNKNKTANDVLNLL